ncbi:MAG TPA: hypothetical protein VEC93_22055 [Anaerolineae bacterium]|nr:hypothetical protein [Anaerolineae bacterium]
MVSKLKKLEGYVGIPHELLHLVGYRLVGKKCRYRWGDPYVKPIGPLTRRERLVGLLFPFGVSSLIFLGLTLLSGGIFAYYARQVMRPPLWAFLPGLLALLSGAYACLSVGDLRRAYLVITGKPAHSPTPLDFLWSWQAELARVDLKFIVFLIVLAIAVLVYTWPN